ncbi:MAG: hypothetical protein CVT95_03770 [Bacteroidetes bacterium HGW-Bacteroidetes-12]|nr:MAG: hypothetical protein CVT95_03770 [Bacteroidetes bacterium HGW-Bacteroidetes-12]
MNPLKYIFLLLITIYLISCRSDNDAVINPNLNHNYAGLAVGNFVIYNVDSIVYDDFTASVNTFQFQIKEKIESQLVDLEGDNSFRIERYRKEKDSINWVLIDVWSSKLVATNYQKVEENVRFIKLVFPIRANKTWNGNIKNNLGEQQYQFTSIHQPEVVGGFALDSVSTVLQAEDINLISENLFEEKFATNIGMVYKRELSRKRNSLSDPWLGKDVTMTLVAYGKE